MKYTYQSLAIIALILTTSCNDAPKADSAEATEAKAVIAPAAGENYSVDVATSHIEWVGTKPTGRHHGNFNLQSGTFTVANNIVTGGNFIIDINSITAFDEDGAANPKLQKHLKSADFFDAEKYNTAKFEITDVQQGVANTNDKPLVMKDATHTITGNLTMKNVTKNISFPAKIETHDNKIIAHAEFNIDRTQWGIVYGSDESLGDKFIRHEVNLKVHLEATR